jgi:tRNA(adenine34) deaminase
LVNKSKPNIQHNDEDWMQLALQQAHLAFQQDEVPVGAIVVYQNQVIGVGHNLREKHHDLTGHAEIIAMKQASKKLGTWRLEACTLYVTLEPCLMCTGAIIQSRIQRVVYGAKDDKSGSLHSQIQIHKIPRVQHLPLIDGGVLSLASQTILKQYFKNKRNEKK